MARGWLRFVLFACACALLACGSPSASTPPAGGAPDAAAIDAAGDGPGASGFGMQDLTDCAALGTGSDVCSYTYLFDPSLCSNRACKKLMIYFSGGQESCPGVAATSSYLAYYAKNGYVAVCAMAFQTSSASGQFPRHAE